MVEAEGDGGRAGVRDHGGEQFEFLRGQFGEPVHPQLPEIKRAVRLAQSSGGGVQQMFRVLQAVPRKPVEIIAQQRGEIAQLPAESLDGLRPLGQIKEGFGRELMTLQFAQGLAEVLGEPGQAGARAEQLEPLAPACDEAAQHH